MKGMAVANTQPVQQLERNAVGLIDVLFQSITSMAPGAAIAASIPLGAAFAAARSRSPSASPSWA